jgi:hypothetical protein
MRNNLRLNKNRRFVVYRSDALINYYTLGNFSKTRQCELMLRGHTDAVFLTSPLSHLPSLASQPSHALLSPLCAHSTGEIEKEDDSLVLHD